MASNNSIDSGQALNTSASVTFGGAVIGGYALSTTCQVWKNTTQSIANTTLTAISWDIAEWNPSNIWSSDSPTRLTAGLAGKYSLQVVVQWDAVAGLGQNIIQIYKNGSSLDSGTLEKNNFGTVYEYTVIAAADTLALAASDYLEIYVYQSSGDALDINPTAPGQCRATLTMVSA